MTHLAQLEDMRVVGKDGHVFGRVFEIRSPGKAESEPTYGERTVDCLLCGRPGLLERLGWKQRDAHRVPWEDVVEIGGDAIVVRGGAGDYQEKDTR
jgi:sporulation protein YlmC with PRC-barrel domain